MIQSVTAGPPPASEPPPETEPDPNFSSEFDSHFLLPMDSLFVSGTDQTHPDLGLFLDDYDELELTVDGFDDPYFPDENEPFLIPSVAPDQERTGNFTPQSEGSEISGDRALDDVDKYLNCWASDSGGCSLASPPVPGERSSDAEKGLNASSPVSSQGSGNCGSGVSEAAKALSPDSNLVVDQKVKAEETGIHSLTKRKKENEDKSEESRSSKYHKSIDNADSWAATGEEEDKRKARLMRNRESAQLSRQRKKHYVEELEEKIRFMNSTIADLNGKISYFMAENSTLRQQLGGGAGVCPPHPHVPGVYMAATPYPCMPFQPYVVKSHGSQVPLIPIPRLKTQQPLQCSKAKKSESRKSESRSKKVASICFLGILLFIFLFGGLAPKLNFRYGGISDSYNGGYRSNFATDRLYNQHRGRVLAVDGHLGFSNGGSKIGLSDSSSKVNSERDYDSKPGRPISCTDKSVPVSNTSIEPLAASLFVPRNDKLEKIDGNLIIHSVLASEKAMASKDSETNKEQESDVPSPIRFSSALTGPTVGRNGETMAQLYRTSKNEHQKALSSGAADNLKDHFKSTAADGKMQQWFREGVVGPMLSSGMCTEVFQFDTSPKPGSVVPAPTTSNVSTQNHQNTTNINKRKNRRILHNLRIPLPGSDSNVTKNQTDDKHQKQRFQESNPASSMVVSVLVDPREGGDGDIDGRMAPKPLSRIFVVVLLDSVKYVTYSCVLPRSGGPPLVTT